MKQFDLAAMLDRTRDHRSSALDALFNGPRLIAAPPDSLFIAPGPDGPIVMHQWGRDLRPLIPLALVPQPLRSWLEDAIPARAAETVDEDGDGA